MSVDTDLAITQLEEGIQQIETDNRYTINILLKALRQISTIKTPGIATPIGPFIRNQHTAEDDLQTVIEIALNALTVAEEDSYDHQRQN